MASDDTARSGTELRAAIDKEFKTLSDSSHLSGSKTDISNTVEPFFPRGMKFERAEELLRSAGFSVGARPKASEATNQNHPRDWYGVLAKINPYLSRPPTKVSAYVTLLPKSPDDYSSIESVSASFFVSTP